MSKRIFLAVSVALVSARLSGAAPHPAPNDAFDTLEQIVDANDIRALHDYLGKHPILTQGDTALAQSLRSAQSDLTFEPETFTYDEAHFNFGKYKNRYKRLERRYDRFQKRIERLKRRLKDKYPHIY
jgi:hypothetical protein